MPLLDECNQGVIRSSVWKLGQFHPEVAALVTCDEEHVSTRKNYLLCAKMSLCHSNAFSVSESM